MSRHGIIYLITNKITSENYVGTTILSMNKEWQHHIMESRKMSRHPLHKAFRDHGIDKFIIKEIDECREELLDERKTYWIEKYNSFQNGYNHEYIPKLLQIIQAESGETIEVKKSNSLKSWGQLTDKNRSDGKHSGLRVRGTNIETGEVKEWETARLAAADVAGNPNKNANILTSARKGHKCYGYKWEILEEKNKRKPIFAIYKYSKKLGPRYESINDAIKDLGNGGAGSALRDSLNAPGRLSWKGYYWYYQ